MGFLSNLTRSWRKSKRLRELQRKIAPPGQSVGDVISDFRSRLDGENSPEDVALEQFLDLCQSDQGIAQVMREHGLERTHLKEIYVLLSTAGLGQWIKGHHAALSTIAYVEPLLFFIESERRATPFARTVAALLEYWDGQVAHGSLLKSLQ